MADITMCQNNKCPLRISCYRFKAIPDQYQSYSNFEFELIRYNEPYCDDYISLESSCSCYGNPEYDVGTCIDCEIEIPERFDGCFKIYKESRIDNEIKSI